MTLNNFRHLGLDYEIYVKNCLGIQISKSGMSLILRVALKMTYLGVQFSSSEENSVYL